MTLAALDPLASRDYPNCPICRQVVKRSLPAQIAPFIRERCDLLITAEGRSHFCESCEHVFLTPFLSDTQLLRLYDGYRDAAYNAQRLKFEPDYGPTGQMLADLDSDHYKRRRGFYDEFCSEAFHTRGLVIDAGDGDGYFGRYAYPYADVVVLPRVGNLPPGVALVELVAGADVLMMAHSLQNQPRPRETLSRLASGLPARAVVWIETPVQYSGGLRGCFEDLEYRTARGVNEFGPLQTLHENLAHFSARSLRRLLFGEGLSVIEFVRSSIGILGVLARRTPFDARLTQRSS